MKFKIYNTEFDISFSFFALIIILMISVEGNSYLAALASALIHECGHIFTCLCINQRITKCKFSVFGIIMEKDIQFVNFKDELFILIMGPLFNLIVYIVLILLKNFECSVSMNLLYTNLSLVLFNMLPFENTDGGSILKLILNLFYVKNKIDIILKLITIITSVCLSCLFLYLYLNCNNIKYILFSVTVLLYGIVPIFSRKNK